MEAKTESLTQELAELVVTTLDLELVSEDIDPHAPLFGEVGLGLDSIDMLEIALAISKRFGFLLRSDQDNDKIFANLDALAKFIALHRTR